MPSLPLEKSLTISAVLIDAAGGRNGQRVHVGHGAAVELAGGVLVDRFDVVVELHHINLDAVLLRPFVENFLWRPRTTA